MRARVRRTAACGPRGTTRPHDHPIRAGNAGTRAWSPPPRRSTPAARRTTRCGDPPEMQRSACKTSRPLAAASQTDHRRRPRRPARDGPEPEEASRRRRGSSIVDGEPRCCIPRPAHAWCGPPDAHEPCDRSDPPGASDPLHDLTGDGAPSSRRPHAPSTLAPSRLAGTIVCPIAVTSTTLFPIVLLCSRLSIMDICHLPGARCQVPGPASDDTTQRHREPLSPTSHH